MTNETRAVNVDDMIAAVVFECSDDCCHHDFGQADMFGRYNKSIREENEKNFEELKGKIIRESVDIDALRLVLDAANNEREYLDEMANNPDCSTPEKVRAKCDALGDAIAKLEHLTK